MKVCAWPQCGSSSSAPRKTISSTNAVQVRVRVCTVGSARACPGAERRTLTHQWRQRCACVAPEVRNVAPWLRRANRRAHVQMCQGRRCPVVLRGYASGCSWLPGRGPRGPRCPLLALKARDVFNAPLVTPSSRVSLLHNWHPLARNRECRWVHRIAEVATAHRSKESTEPKLRRVRARVRMRACVHDLVCACVLASSVQGHTHK